MCGHCTIGAVTVILESGLKEMHEGENEVVLDAPAGLIRTTAFVKDGKVEHVTFNKRTSIRLQREPESYHRRKRDRIHNLLWWKLLRTG